MIKHIHFYLTSFLLFTIPILFSNNLFAGNPNSGYYQQINLDAVTPCNCGEKTERTYELNKGLREGEVTKYQLHAYQFAFGESILPASKLFKAFESDKNIYKVSVKEWTALMLLTTPEFDKASFETAAKSIFKEFTPIDPADYLKNKNTESYTEYIQSLKKETNEPKERNNQLNIEKH